MKIFKNNILTSIDEAKGKFVNVAQSTNKLNNNKSCNKAFLNASLIFLKKLLSIFLIIEMINLPLIILGLIYFVYKSYNMKNNLMNVLLIITLICITIITFELREIIKSFINREVFVLKNALRLRKIGFSTMIVGVFILINNIIKYGTGVFVLLNLDNNGIVTRIDTVLGVFIGVIILIFAEIFKEAVNIKKENDLTI